MTLAPLFSVSYVTFYSALVSIRDPIVRDVPLRANNHRWHEVDARQQGAASVSYHAKPPAAPVSVAFFTRPSYYKRKPAQRRDGVDFWLGGQYAIREAANTARIRRGGTLVRVELNQAAYRPWQRSPARWSRIRSHPPAPSSAPSSPCPRRPVPPPAAPPFRESCAPGPSPSDVN